MGDAAAYAYIAMQEAIEDSGLEESDVSNPMTGLIASSGGASSNNIVHSADTLRDRGVRYRGRTSLQLIALLSRCHVF